MPVPERKELKDTLSTEIYYDHYNSDETQETGTVSVYFSREDSAIDAREKINACFKLDHFIFTERPYRISHNDKIDVYCLGLRLNPHHLRLGQRGIDILDRLDKEFSNLPNELIVSYYDKDAPDMVVKNFCTLNFSERNLVRASLATFAMETGLRKSSLHHQLAALCGSPVMIRAINSSKANTELSIACVNREARVLLISKLFDLANRFDMFHLISFKTCPDVSQSSFILNLQAGLSLEQLLSFVERPQAACSSEPGGRFPGFFDGSAGALMDPALEIATPDKESSDHNTSGESPAA